MRVAITGAGGQLGQQLTALLGERHQVTPLSHQALDICDHAAVSQTLRDLEPQAVINTAAYHRVDEVEDHLDRALAVNTLAVANLAAVCQGLDAALVHFSTDYVFDGAKGSPYTEEDAPNPLSAYGVSKLAGEYLVRSYCRRHFVVRTTGLIGLAGTGGKGGNFVETMLRLAREGRPIRVVDDQVLTPTSTKGLAAAVARLLDTESYGIYHITNGGSCSWHQFAQAIFQLSGMEPDLRPTTSAEYGARARRPSYSVLDNGKARRLGLGEMRHWREALAEYLEERRGRPGDAAQSTHHP